MTIPPTHAQLGAALRSAAESARRLGDAYRWRPEPGSTAETRWQSASGSDPLNLTLAEGEAHGVLLVRSALEHTSAVATAISSRRPFLPHSIGRTGLEHALRAHHLLDPDETPTVRAGRRLDEWLYAVTESGYRRIGIVKAGHPNSENLPDEEVMVERIRIRAVSLGMEMVKAGKAGYRVTQTGRASTMRLAESQLGAGGAGVPAFLIRNHAAVAHGVETGLLASAVDRIDLDTGTNVPEPTIAEPPDLAYGLMCVPLAMLNAVRALSLCLEWEESDSRWRDYTRDHARLIQTWERAVELSLDAVAPDRPRTGIFGDVHR